MKDYCVRIWRNWGADRQVYETAEGKFVGFRIRLGIPESVEQFNKRYNEGAFLYKATTKNWPEDKDGFTLIWELDKKEGEMGQEGKEIKPFTLAELVELATVTAINSGCSMEGLGPKEGLELIKICTGQVLPDVMVDTEIYQRLIATWQGVKNGSL